MIRFNVFFATMLVLALSTDARAVTINWSPVGNPGNAAETATGLGAVGYSYNIGTYDVTNAQYVEFLNAKDPSGADPLGLYHHEPSQDTFLGISFNAGGVNGSKYNIVAGRANQPVSSVSWYNAARFANWINNGQGNGDTETGAYTLEGGTPAPTNGLTVTRNPAARVFLPTVDEWNKAGFYNSATGSYFQYATSSNTLPSAVAPPGSSNSANWHYAVNHPTDVGAYTASPSPYGTFDQAGNIIQWTESFSHDSFRIMRGAPYSVDSASFFTTSVLLTDLPQNLNSSEGFRLASVAGVPEPSAFALAAFGFAGLAVWSWRRWNRR